ncbi:unnamed protein product, partial [Rotaria sp. Silwood2]
MEKLSIDSVKTLLAVEDDIFSLLQENCSALKDIKERACLCLNDGTAIVKPGLRIDLDRFIEALCTKSIHSQISQSTTASADNDSSLSDTLTKFNMFEENNNSFLKNFINNMVSNKKKSKNNYRYNASVQSFAQALYIMGGRNAYEFVRLNLSGAVPSITSIDSFIAKAGGKIMEGGYGITNKFNSIDVLRRWLWIFEHSQTSNIRILAFSTDCDPKYLRAMRLITGFFAKLPNIPVSERDDALEVKLPKEWSSWFYIRTRQLFFCFQDPVHICTKI